MDLINVIVSRNNLNEAYKKVVANKGAAGIDKMTVDMLDDYIKKNRNKFVGDVMKKRFYSMPVRRVYIPKANGDKRPLGIPTAHDRVIHQAIAKPTDTKFLGFTFLNCKGIWTVKPLSEKIMKFKKSISEYIKRNRACARSFDETIIRLNQMIRGLINYFKIGMINTFMKEFGQWLRHKTRVIIIKQWKRPRTLYKNLMYLNKRFNNNFNDESISKVANSRIGLYKQCSMEVVNYIISPKLLETKTKDRPVLANPLKYF